jgi:hypothetical protein
MAVGEWSYNATEQSTKASSGKSEKVMGVPYGEGPPLI